MLIDKGKKRQDFVSHLDVLPTELLIQLFSLAAGKEDGALNLIDSKLAITSLHDLLFYHRNVGLDISCDSWDDDLTSLLGVFTHFVTPSDPTKISGIFPPFGGRDHRSYPPFVAI
ncbi:hypothetical protein ONZ45_g9105 [Pleurotus djamor]|nr:hypothetical protein ONZ45_g9105 [Pleurotus djamor]